MTVPLNKLTKTVAQVLEMPISEDLKEELRKHPPDWCVMLDDGNVMVAPPQDFEVPELDFSPLVKSAP